MPTSLEHGRMVQSMIYLIQTRLLNLLIVAAWLNHMLMFAPFLLVLGRLCPSSMCVHAKAKTRSQQTSNGRKRYKVHIKRHKADKRDRHGKHRYKDVRKQARRQTSKIANKQAKRKTSKRWCPRGTNVGLDQISITSFVLNQDRRAHV